MGRLAEAIRSFWLGPYSSGDPALSRLFGGPPAAAGISVNEYTAMNYAAVWQAVTIIAGGIASMPLILYKRLPNGGRDKFDTHPLYRLLHDRPNPEMSSMAWREALLAHALTWGNGYSEIQFDQAGRPVALWPIAPNRVTPYRERGSARLLYRVLNEQDTGYATLTPDRMFHVRNLSPDGICGYSVIRHAREAIGLGLAAERYGARFFGTGAMFSVALEHPARLSADAQKRLKENWNEQHGGVDRSHGVAVLEEGMKVSKLSMPPEDAQFLMTRQFQTQEICRFFNLAPYKMRDIEKAASYSSVEQAAIDHVTDTLRPWMVRVEQEIGLKLIRPLEQGIQYAEHLPDALLRGVTLERNQSYAVAVNGGWMSRDEVRAKENMNAMPDGQGAVFLVPLNMAPADKIEALADAQIEAKTTTPPAAAQQPRQLREWQEAVVEDIAARLTRRELTFVEGIEQDRAIGQGRGLPHDAAREAERLETFYRRYIDDGVLNLRPWLQRFRPDGALDGVVRTRLVEWASSTKKQILLAWNAQALRDIVRTWSRERERLLTQALMEAIDGD